MTEWTRYVEELGNRLGWDSPIFKYDDTRVILDRGTVLRTGRGWFPEEFNMANTGVYVDKLSLTRWETSVWTSGRRIEMLTVEEPGRQLMSTLCWLVWGKQL
jgi:hypothetical protein